MKYPDKYVVLDFETTGLDHKECKVLEIGLMQVVPGYPDFEFTTVINWGQPVPAEITKITGITQEMADAGMDPEEAKQKLREFLVDFPIIGHNVYNFDFKFLDKFLELSHYDWDLLMTNFVDTAVMMKAKKMGEDQFWNEPYHKFADRIMTARVSGLKFNLGLCCEELGIEKDNQHRAMSDVRLTNEVYKKLCLA